MAKKFFLRNDPETIKNATSMTEEEFVTHYNDTMSTPEALRKAHQEMNKKVKNNAPGKKDQVIENDEPINIKDKDPEVPVKTQTKFNGPCDGEVTSSSWERGTNTTTINTKSTLRDKMESAASGSATPAKKAVSKKEPKDPNAPKKEGGFKKTEDGDKRDARITELLGQKMPVAKILDTMTSEGIKVFGPQIYKIKKVLDQAAK